MSYSEEARRKAAEQVRDYGALKGYPSSWLVAIDLQCRLNELEEANRWIPVSERLPEGGSEVLGYRQRYDETRIFKYIENAKQRLSILTGFFADFELDTEVTHWRPLPTPPKENGQNN